MFCPIVFLLIFMTACKKFGYNFPVKLLKQYAFVPHFEAEVLLYLKFQRKFKLISSPESVFVEEL